MGFVKYMGLLDRFKRKGPPEKATAQEKVAAVKSAAGTANTGKEKSLQDLKKEEGKTATKASVVKKSKENTGNAYKVLIRPVITEKSAVLADQGKYVFEVPGTTNKVEVAKAVKLVYGVHPVKVNMIKLPTKKIVMRYRRYMQGNTSPKFKAIVTLKKGEKIGLFDGV